MVEKQHQRKTLQFPSLEYLNALSERTVPLSLEFFTSGLTLDSLPATDVPEIAIVGRSNVGKSSLINFLAGQRHLARVSRTPGRTQTINFFAVDKGKFLLVDLPGYGYAQVQHDMRSLWEQSMFQFFSERKNLIGVLFLIDARREVEDEDRQLVAWFQGELGLKVLGVQTKCDKLSKSEQVLQRRKHEQMLGVAPGMLISTSASERLGLSALCRGIAGLLISARIDYENSSQ